MTILLVLSFLNALFNIFSAPILYFGTPMMNEMLASGAFEESLKPFLATMSEADVAAIMDRMRFMVDLNPMYYLFNFILFSSPISYFRRRFSLPCKVRNSSDARDSASPARNRGMPA